MQVGYGEASSTANRGDLLISKSKAAGGKRRGDATGASGGLLTCGGALRRFDSLWNVADIPAFCKAAARCPGLKRQAIRTSGLDI